MAGRSGGPGKGSDGEVKTQTLEITEEDAAFILGKGGRTKMKLAKVSQCHIELLDQELTLEFTGTAKQRRCALRYVNSLIAQRQGEVVLSREDTSEDCTVLSVPKEAIGFVTGSRGNFLRTLEDEHHTIMCFAQVAGTDHTEEQSDLVIWGERPARRAAQLAVMSVVETKVPGYYTERWRNSGTTFDNKSDLHGDWGTSTMELVDEELSYAIGAQGKTRKKLARSSGCVVQYVSKVVFMSGTRLQREHAKEYLKWLLEQLEGPIAIDVREREDATILEVPHDCIGYVTGNRRETLGLVEETYGVIMFFMAKGSQDKTGSEQLVIFGNLRERRGAELMVMSAVERKNAGHYTDHLKDRKTTTKGFDVDRLLLSTEDMAYALGKEGSTRNKLALASGAILQFVSCMAFIGGDAKERQRCRDYVGWLLAQKDGKVNIDREGRTDVTDLELASDDIGYILGPNGLPRMREIELECHVFCVLADDDGEGGAKLQICGHEEGSTYSETGRLRAHTKLSRLLQDRPDWYSKGHSGLKGKGGKGQKGGGKHGGWHDARSRSPRGGASWGASGGGGHSSYSSGARPQASYSSRAYSSTSGGGWSSSGHRGGRDSWEEPRGRAALPATRAGRGRSPTPPWRQGGGGAASSSGKGGARTARW